VVAFGLGRELAARSDVRSILGTGHAELLGFSVLRLLGGFVFVDAWSHVELYPKPLHFG
jgi:hypothetical protein